MSELLGIPWWVILFFAVGLAAFGTLILDLFFEIGGRPDELEATEAPRVDSPEFVAAVAGSANAPQMEGGRAELLNNGVAVFPAMIEAIRQAEANVNFMMYIWNPGQASDMILEALTERARAGVEIRVLIDGLGGKNAPEHDLDRLKAAGGKVDWFRPPRFGKLTRIHTRNHRRAIIIDGKVGFTGGIAVSDEWLGDAQNPDQWRDCMIRFSGCTATNLQSAFAQLWSAVTGEIFVGEAFYPSDPETDGEGEQISVHVPIISSPSAENYLLRRPFWLSFRCARERIWITNPYFVPDSATRNVLKRQARDGVDVRVLVPNQHIDVPVLRWAAQYYYGELLESGIRIWEYQPTMLHAKLLVVDGVWSIVGSANLDVRSQELNEEVIVGILDHGFARELEATFRMDLERAREIRLEEWRERSWLVRARSRIFKTLEEQY